MKHVNTKFANSLELEGRERLLFNIIPTNLENLILDIINESSNTYLDDGNKVLRVSKQAFIKLYQDFKVIKFAIQQGYQVQAATIASSMLETIYFIASIGYHPEKAEEWLNHDKYEWSEGFYNWRSSALAAMTKDRKISQSQREHLNKMDEEFYKILCAAKHGNGFSIRSSNVIVDERQRPYLVSQPEFTLMGLAECGHYMTIAIGIAAQGVKYYLNATNQMITKQIDIALNDITYTSHVEYDLMLEELKLNDFANYRFYLGTLLRNASSDVTDKQPA
jgi:hypothetical protein